MEPFRPRTAPRLRSQTHSPDDDDRYQSTTSEEDGAEEGISNTYDCINRRMTFEEAFLKSRGNNSRQYNEAQDRPVSNYYARNTDENIKPLTGFIGGGERGNNNNNNNQVGPFQQQLPHFQSHLSAGLSSSSQATSEDDDANSDVTFTDSELALARDCTLVLHNPRLLASSVSNLSSVPPAMGRTGGRGSLTSSTPNNPLSTLSKGDGKQCKDAEQEYRTSCLVRTPSGALFIPSDIPKGPLSPQHKGDIPITQSTTLQEETKKHPDRCQLSYTSSTSVPNFPVRNNVRRPVSSHFIHSRLHFRKTLSSRCTWKCTAIAFIFLTIALLTALTYFIAVTVLNWQYANKQPCPVMVEDMGLVDDSKDVKSTYQDSWKRGKTGVSDGSIIRKIREVGDANLSTEFVQTTTTTFPSLPINTTADFMDSGSGEHASLVVPETGRTGTMEATRKTALDLEAEDLLLVSKETFSKQTNEISKIQVSDNNPLTTVLNRKNVTTDILSNATNATSMDDQDSDVRGLQHDSAAVSVPSKTDNNATDNEIYSVLNEHESIQPISILIPPANLIVGNDRVEVNMVEYAKPEVAPGGGIGKGPVLITRPTEVSYGNVFATTVEDEEISIQLHNATQTEEYSTYSTVNSYIDNFSLNASTNSSSIWLEKLNLSITELYGSETIFSVSSSLSGNEVSQSTEEIILQTSILSNIEESLTQSPGESITKIDTNIVMPTVIQTVIPNESNETSNDENLVSKVYESTAVLDLSNESSTDVPSYEECCTCDISTTASSINESTDNLVTTEETTEISTDHSPSSLPSQTMPPVGESFSEVQIGKKYTQKISSFGHWNIQFLQNSPSLVKFNYSVPEGASIGIYGRRNGIPSHTRYDFVEILNTKQRRTLRSAKDTYFSMEFVQFLDRGLWYISVYNDGDNPQEIDFVPIVTDESSLPCPYDCHGHGVCVVGSCVCDADYAGESCSNRICPVLCSGRGQYVAGECSCSPGWKGKECQLREDECEVSDCNGRGDCVDGNCRCFLGYKGAHCEEVDCLDPDCSGHGTCMNGMCFCRKGWKGADCSETDSDTLRCLPDCSSHGHFDVELQQCICEENWTGPDCSEEKCDLNCGIHGRCQNGLCNCLEGWSGPNCNEKLCDPRCVEHGECKNGTCVCNKGWNGQHCSLDGCPQNCNNHGECVMVNKIWRCRCESNWDGSDCSIPLERICDDRVDNDKDGLIDCADTECCSTRACENNPLCFAAADPLDILLRKQPPAVTASFFQRMQFLIEEDSVQSYVNKNSFNDSRASVIRGQVVSPLGNGLMGIRVGMATDPLFGFTVTRDTGWFDLMVNGGGAVTLQFQREPFKPHERTVIVPWNEIVVMDKVVMTISEEKHPEYKSTVCFDHNYDTMKPVVLATWKHGFQGGCPEKSSILSESQVIQESLPIPGTKLHLVYHSSRVGGYLSTIQLQLTPDIIPPSLRLIYLRISIEGILFERKFEADPGIKYTYAWNRRNIYRQKVYGVATAIVYVGYEYSTCPHVIWEVQTTQVSGHDMSISEIGGWNLDIHHQYNYHEGILQKGDGTNIYLKNKPKVLLTAMGDGHQRPMHCHHCNGIAKQQRLLAPVALTNAPDGSIYVGDFNLIRRITPDGMITTIVELSAAQVAYRYHLAVGPADSKLYISDPERHQIFRVINLNDIVDIKNNIEVVVGSGSKCLPGDKLLCGDGRTARDAKLAYPKGMAISAHNEIFIADGTNIRMVDRNGIIHTIVGDHYHKSHWKPFPCGKTITLSQVNLRWPTELAINPLDGTLHILDDHLVLKLTPDKRLKVIAGKPLQCPSSHEKSDQANDVFLESPQSIAFAPNGDLYIAESDSQFVNRVRVIGSDGRISKFAGAEMKCSCLDINCKCFDEDNFLAATSKLNTISSITVTPDGLLHICDQGNLRIWSVTSSLPKPNDSHEYEIYSPETQEIYSFNRHGQHTTTKNILTGKIVYTFSYNVNTSFGKLSTVTDAAGNKIYILRDYSNQVKTIENTRGGKCRLEMTRMRMLQSFTTPDNFKTVFEYHGSTGLLRSKIDSSGKSFLYGYDKYGRLTQAVTPSGHTIKLSYNLSIKGAAVTVTRNDKTPVSLLIKGSDVTINKGSAIEKITKDPDNSLIITKEDSRTIEMETVPSPVLADQSPVLGETFPVPAKLKTTLNDEVSQKFEWRYYLRREGKGRNRQITQVGRKMKINGETLVAVEFDREQYSETIYDKNQIPLVTVRYDEFGHPKQWEPSQNLTPVKLEYDRFGRLARWERGYLSERYSFDIQGRLAEIRYSDNSGIMYRYDDSPISLPTEIILPSGSRYLLQYDTSGSLQAVITPNGHKHEIATQTSLGFYKLLYLSPGVKHPYILHFNDQGLLLAKLHPNNQGRVVYYYTNNGQLTSVFCGNERTDISYYEQHSLIKTTMRRVPGLECRVDYRYHGSLLKEERYRYNSRSGLDSLKLKYQYDSRLSNVELEINGKGASEIKFKYNAETGILEQVQQFLFHKPKINSIFIQDDMRQYSKTIGYDSYGRIVVLAMTLWNKEIYSLSLQYDSRSRIRKSIMKIGKENSPTVTNYSYTIDGFLEEVTGTDIWRFIYDINGNMKSLWEGQHQISLRYDDGDRLVGYGDVELYMVDSRGYIIQRGQEKFQFNAEGQLIHAFELHQYEVYYYYDVQKRLIARKDHRGNITQFLYADLLNPYQITHIHFPQVGITTLLLYDSNSHLMYIQQGTTKYYVATDHLGTPVGIFDTDGNIVKEVQRSPFGKVLSDSNADFYLPLDFQGGIRDPLTQLIHFNSRIYDPLGAQWLTLNWEDVPELLNKPFNMHLYRFHSNDPVNIPNTKTQQLTELKDWLAVLGFNMEKVPIYPKLTNGKYEVTSMWESLPTISGLSCTANVMASEFCRFSTVPQTEVKVEGNFLRSINSRIATLPSVLGDGILLSKVENRAIVHIVNEASPLLRDIITSVFNSTFLLDLHFSVHGQDSFYFVQEDAKKVQTDWEQLQRLGNVFNITMHPVESSDSLNNNGQIDLRLQSTSVALNIRYGTTLEEERWRIIRYSRQRAVEEAWQQEVELLQSGHRGSHDWTKSEKEELLANKMVAKYHGTDIHDIDKYPELADDPTNIMFRKESNRKRRGRPRRPRIR
ncbi:teneurin-m-like isoform X2 [Centruroides sculpturatus]|uniref:teneurin-m-like isoform X2 n=1 Tax=Centruroides sculpturatus TaxID=218467 RepID=UPI000C6D9E51|nr:teneurin-m-like isoform X2 [Centruroides sculpturatus]